MTEKEYLEQSLRLLQIIGQEKLKRLPDDPRNKFKYTVSGSRSDTEFYTNSIVKAKEKMIQILEPHIQYQIIFLRYLNQNETFKKKDILYGIDLQINA